MDAAQGHSVPVVVVQHQAPEGAPVFQPHLRPGQLHAEVATRPRAMLVTKSQASVFSGTELRQWLNANAIDTLSICAYMTHNCGASTVFEAAHRGLAVEFLRDASGSLPYKNEAGSASAEEIHRVFCVVFQSNFAAVVSTDQWVAALGQNGVLPKSNIVQSNRQARDAALR